MSAIQDKLEKLADCYEANGFNVRKYLAPPLSRDQVLEGCSWFPHELPSQIIDMYTWSGGSLWPGEVEYPFFLIDDAVFSTIEYAQSEYYSLQEIEQYDETCEIFGLDLATCYPIALNDYSSYSVPCSDTHQWHQDYPAPVVSTFEIMQMHYHSIESMLDTNIEWMLHPEWAEYGHDGSIYDDILRKNNPGLKFHGE